MGAFVLEGTNVNAYKASVSFTDKDGDKTTIERGGFESSSLASAWVAEKFARLICSWSELNPDGIYVEAEISQENTDFLDLFTMQCGM